MKHIIDYIKRNLWLLLLIVPAFFIYMVIIFPSGSHYCFKGICGIYFWGVHGHDAIWHLAITNVSFNQFPFSAPTFAGARLTGYNYIYDLIIHLISFTGIPAIISYFKVMPVIWFVTYTVLLIILARKIKDKPLFVGLFLFFAYFSESFAYILTWMHYHTIWGSAGMLATIKVHMMSNPPFAFSVLILLMILIILYDRKINTKTILFIGVLNLLNLGLKFYGGAVSFFLVGVYILVTYFRKDPKKMFIYGFTQLLFLVIAIIAFYDPFTSLKSGAIFTFSPFAMIHTITEEPDLFYLRKLTDARYFLISRGIGPRLILIEFLNLILFIFFYLGVKIFGIFYVGRKIMQKKITRFDICVILTMIFATGLTATLVQKAEWWNVIQFFYYVIFLSTIYITLFTYDLLTARKWKVAVLIFAGILFIMAIPVTLDVIREYASIPGATYISDEELTALKFLSRQPAGTVIAPLYNPVWKRNGLNELYRYVDTAYVAAFTGKPVFFANILQLRLTGVDYTARLKRMQNPDCSLLNGVKYIYEIRPVSRKPRLAECPQVKIKKILDNPLIYIYSVTK